MKESDAHVRILNLMARFCHLTDRGPYDEVANLFTDDGVIYPEYESDAEIRGRAAIDALYDRSPQARGIVRYLRHHIDTVFLEFDGPDRASGTSYLTADMVMAKDDSVRVLAGRYDDVFSRIDGTWLIAERRMIVHYVRAGQDIRMARRPDN